MAPTTHKAYLDIKQKMTEASVLRDPDLSKVFEVACDATGVGVGGILSQDSHSIAYLMKNSMRLNNVILLMIRCFMHLCYLFVIDVIICCPKSLSSILTIKPCFIFIPRVS